MNLTAREALSGKKGLAEALGSVIVAMTLLIAVGAVVTNYAVLSRHAAELTSMRQAISNRAALYATQLNANMLYPQVPDMARECSTATQVCTQVLTATRASDWKTMTLSIQADSDTALPQTQTEDVTLYSSIETHVTSIQPDGQNVWAQLPTSGVQFITWGLAQSQPTVVPPQDVTGPTATQGVTWVDVATRAGIDSAGNLWVWGPNDQGQAGIGHATTTPVAPQQVAVPSGVTFRTVITTPDRAYAIDSTGQVWAWGANANGQLGLGTTAPTMTPTSVPAPRMIMVAADGAQDTPGNGGDTVFGITTTGDLLEEHATPATSTAPAVPGTWEQVNPGTQYSDVSWSGSDHTVATITTAGVLTVNPVGQAGEAPGEVVFPAGATFTHVSLTDGLGYAIAFDGTLYSWSQQGFSATLGQLGQGTTTSSPVPAAIMSGTKFVSVQASPSAVLAVDTAGNLYYTGTDFAADAQGPLLPQENTLTPLMPGVTFRQVSAFSQKTAVALLDTQGNLYGMGTPTPGLWPIDYQGTGTQPIRMPLPAGFGSYTWK